MVGPTWGQCMAPRIWWHSTHGSPRHRQARVPPCLCSRLFWAPRAPGRTTPATATPSSAGSEITCVLLIGLKTPQCLGKTSLHYTCSAIWGWGRPSPGTPGPTRKTEDRLSTPAVGREMRARDAPPHPARRGHFDRPSVYGRSTSAGPILGRFSTLESKLVKIIVRYTSHP